MKKLIMALLCLQVSVVFANAKGQKSGPSAKGEGNMNYHIVLKMTGTTDSMVFLVHYYGTPGPKVYKMDSARFSNKGVAEFTNWETGFTGGIYLFMLSEKRSTFEFLLNKGDDITVSANEGKTIDGIKFKNSPENERFQDYQQVISAFAKQQDSFKAELSEAKTADDTALIRHKSLESVKALTKYKTEYRKKYPGTLLANIFGAMETPEVPSGDHFLEDGITKDSAFAFRYYKSHYWDGVDFHDDRLIYTPIYDGHLEDYFSRFVVPMPDSMEKECDMLLAKTRGTNDFFHYTLYWLTSYVENSKIMGMDEVFVYLVENYYMKGDATWLSSSDLAKYIDRATKIAPNIIGNIAPEVSLPNVITKKQESLQALKAKYTLVVFYAPTCGHCQHELPILDSVYEAVLKDKGVRIFTVATEGDSAAIASFLVKLKTDKKWTNTWDPEHTSNYHNQYDVYSTPTIYLLDEKKIIRGKRLDHTNIPGLVDMLENKNKKTAHKS